MYDLEKLKITDAEYAPKFQKLMEDLIVHMRG